MARAGRTIADSVREASPSLGAVLDALYSSKRGKVPVPVRLSELVGDMRETAGSAEATLRGALALLHAMGMVRFHGEEVGATSRDAGLFLGSLAKFLNSSVASIHDPLDQKGAYSKITHVLETARRRRDQGVQVDQSPLHHRHIVNLVIKGRMKRGLRYKDVYLHEYDADWKQYHLIGRALVEGSPAAGLEGDKHSAHSIVQDSLRLRETQYELDASINPAAKCLKHISDTSGAYTEYSYRLFVVKNIDPRLSANSHLREEKGRGPYRWFTWEEIKNCCSTQGEPIIFSTPELLEDLDLDGIPVSAVGADDPRHPVSIRKELGYRFSKRQLSGVALALAFLLGLQMLPWLAGSLQMPDATLSRLAASAQIVSGVLAVGFALTVVVRVLLSARKD